MKTSIRIYHLFLLLPVFLVGCQTIDDVFDAVDGMFIDQSILDSWVGVPVAELDFHTWFITVPMTKTVTEDGTEIRNYKNSSNSRVTCNTTTNFPYKDITRCSGGESECNNIFYIREGVVTSYQLSGNCRTGESLRPQYKRY